MLSESVIKKIKSTYHGRPLVIEGANGSLGLSTLRVLKELEIVPSEILLTTFNSDPHSEWLEYYESLRHLRSSSHLFFTERQKVILSFRHPANVIFGSGYGRPNIFLNNFSDIIDANINSLLGYLQIPSITTFAYMSTSELYTGSTTTVNEHSPLLSTPDHSRSVYIESKRLGEAIVNNLISKISHRYAIYRVALATPPMLLPNDNRVLSDLINSAISNGIVRLKGGAEFIRQYQYGPNAVYKMLGSLVNGSNNLYINAGSHVLTLGDLAQIISCIFNVPLVIDTMLHDHTAPPVVLLDTSRIDRESEYINSLECSFESYIRKIANAKT